MLRVADLIATAMARVPEVSLEEFQREAEAGQSVLLDVRESEETNETGLIPGSRNVPRGALEWYADTESPMHAEFMSPDKRVILFSFGGERSCVAGLTLLEMGYHDVADFRGGVRAWLAGGGRMISRSK